MADTVTRKLFTCSVGDIVTKIGLRTSATVGFIYCDVSGFANKIILKIIVTSLIVMRVLCSEVFIATYR